MMLLQELKRYKEALEPALLTYFDDAGIPASLAEGMRYSITAGGKRLRGCLCLAACELACGNMEKALPFACALEMIHTYSLIHDDLPCMDNDDFRRGKPTNHKVFGEGNAVLAGDGLLSLAFEIMLREASISGDPQSLHAALSIAEGAGIHGMVAGQAVDLENEKLPHHDGETLRYIHRHKTGSLLIASILSGALAGGANQMLLAALKRFGEAYGVLFQITDDILDVTGDFEHMGKTLGKDAQADKLTYVSLYGVDGAKQMAQATAAEAIASLEEYPNADFFRSLCEYTLFRNS